jgi:hypothetical protein
MAINLFILEMAIQHRFRGKRLEDAAAVLAKFRAE